MGDAPGWIPPNRFLPAGGAVPDAYPSLPDGSTVPFTPLTAPMPTETDLERVLNKHRHQATGAGKTLFRQDWSDRDVANAIEMTIRAPDPTRMQRRGDKVTFEAVVGGDLIRVHIRVDLDPPRFWSAFAVQQPTLQAGDTIDHVVTAESFARRLLDKYRDVMDERDFRVISEDYDAGEYEVAAISTVETAPVNLDEVEMLMTLAAGFVGVDAQVASLVAAKARGRVAAR